MIVSVVVPTRDRPKALRSCLRAVRAQDDIRLEVIVVDDGSATHAAVEVIAAEHEARVVRLDGVGPSAARNAGVRETRGAVVLLLDDDCVPRPGWAGLLAGVVEQSGCVAAGRVAVPAGASVWLRASERLAVQAEEATGFFRTLAIACPRSLLLRIPFDPRFPDAAGEDRDWCARIARSGVNLVRVDEAIVEHRAASDWASFARQQRRWGAAVRLLRRRGTHVPVPMRRIVSGSARAAVDDPAALAGMVVGLGLTSLGLLAER